MALKGPAFQRDARTQGMAEWQGCWAVQAEKPTDARANAAGAQPVCHVDGRWWVGAGLFTAVLVLAYNSIVRERDWAAGVNTP